MSAVAPQALLDRPAHQQDEQAKQQECLKVGDDAVDHLPGCQRRDSEQYRQLLAQDLRVHGQGAEHSGDADNQRDVGDVGAVGIAQCQARIPLAGGNGGDDHLGRRCPGNR